MFDTAVAARDATAKREGRIPRVETICEGDPEAMGFAQGQSLRDKIHAARRVLADLEAFRLRQPWWLPYWLRVAYDTACRAQFVDFQL